MGYDMNFEDASEGEGDDYFRLNIFAMGRYATAMYELGMAADGKSHPKWPELPDGVTWDDIEAVRYPEDNDKGLPAKPGAVAHEKAHQRVLAWHDDGIIGIAGHKFDSNDGWLVTPDEIGQAIDAYRKHSGEHVKSVLADAGIKNIDYWLKWIGYLERAQRHGGFRVW